jgi:Cache domain
MKRSVLSPVVALLIGFLVILSLSAALLALLAGEHKDVGSHAHDDADRLALVVEREISRNVDLIDLSIEAVADGVQQPAVMRLPMDLRDQVLFSRAAAARYIRDVSVFDSNGTLVANSLDSGQKLDPPFRSAFLAARQQSGANRLLVGHPYLDDDRITRLVTFSRSIWNPNGIFDGVVVATVNLNDFSEVLLDVQDGHRTVVQVSLRDGTELLRTLEPEDRLSASDNIVPRLSDKLALWLARVIDPGTAGGAITAQWGVVAAPMVVTVSLSSSDIFADWLQRCKQVALLCLAVSLVFAALSAYLAYILHMRAIGSRS